MRGRDGEKNEAVKAAPKRGGLKALRVIRRKAYYAARPAQTALSKKRTLGRQVRWFPEDAQAQRLYVERYGDKALKGHLASLVARARRRMAQHA